MGNYTISSINPAYNENTHTLSVTDQIKSDEIVFSVKDPLAEEGLQYAGLVGISVVTPVNGLNITISNVGVYTFKLQVETTPLVPLGGNTYTGIVAVEFHDPDDPFGQNQVDYLHIHLIPLVYKICYYDNNILSGGNLVKCWIHPEFVVHKGPWVSGSAYNPDDRVEYPTGSGITWQALRGMYPPDPMLTTPPAENTYWTSFPYDNANFHARAACLDKPNNTNKISSVWASVSFSTSIEGKFLNPVFYENGSKPFSSDPTGKLVGSGTELGTKNLLGGFYEANVSDTSIGSQFYLSFSYASPDPTDPTNPAKYRYPNPRPAMPPLTIVKEITSTFTSNGSPVSSPVTLRAGATEQAYPLKVVVNNHVLTLPTGTNYANLLYRRDSDFGAGGFNDFSPITTNNTAPVYISSSVENTFVNSVGTTSYQLRFNTEGTYYIIGRPTGDLNQQSSTLGNTTNALRVVVEPAISTAFTFTPVTPPITGYFDVPINMSAVSPGNLRWTLHPFNGIMPPVYLCSKNSSTNTVSKLFSLGTNTNVDQPQDFVYPIPNISYLLRVELDALSSQSYSGILTLKNRDYALASDTTADFSFARPSATFVIEPSTISVPQFGQGTISGSYTGLAKTVTGITYTGGSGTLTFGTPTFTGGTTGTFKVPITNATTENLSGYPVLIKAQHTGVDIAGASAEALVKVTASAGKPTLGLYNSGSEYPVLCQTQASDTDAVVCGGWYENVKKTDPLTATKNLVNKAYLTLRDIDTNTTKAGLYTISASLDGISNWTPVLNPGLLDSDTSSNDYLFITIARHDSTAYPISVTIRNGRPVTDPYIYLRVSTISGIDSVAFRLTFIPNIQVVAGTETTGLVNHTAKIENDAGALFVIKTAYDGWSAESVRRYETSNSLYVGFPNTPPFLKDETWVVEKNGAKSAGAARYNLFFETNALTGPFSCFVVFKYPDGTELLVYRVLFDIVQKGGLNLRTAAGTTTATAAIGDVVNFSAVNVDSQRLYVYSQNASDLTAWTITTPSSQNRSHIIGSTDRAVYIVASYGDLLGAIKYTIVGQGCTLTATSSFLNTFTLPTASENYYYPSGAPSTALGLKLPFKVQVINLSGGAPEDKTVKSDGTGWQFLSASYSGIALEILPLSQSMRLDALHPTSFNFQITRGTGTDYRLSLPSGLNVGGLPISGSSVLNIVFKANFSDGKCATISRSVPVRQFTYTVDSPVTSEACNYFPPNSGGSQQYALPSGYSSLEEVIANNISISTTDFISKYGLSVFSDKITTLALTTPLESATLSEAYYGFSDLNYNVYVVVGNGTPAKKIVPLAYYKQYTAPNYLPYPQKIGLTPVPVGTSLTCYNGDKVYISLLSTISSAFNFTNYDLVFINGASIIPQSIGNYDPTNKVLSFDVTPGIFVTGTPYTLGVRHKTTDCVYFGTTSITFTCGGPRPSGPIEIMPPVEQEPCTLSIPVNAKSSTGTDISAITRVQVYSTSGGSVVDNYTGNISVWDNITPTIGSTKKDLFFVLNNSTKVFSSLITSKKQQNFFVSFYTGSGAGGYVPFAQGVPLALVLKNPVLKGTETNNNRTPVLTSPVPTLYENTLSITCSSCKDGSCGNTDLASLTTIDWAASLSAPLPAWLSLLPGPTENTAILSGSPTTTAEDSFVITVSVPYYLDGGGAPYIHTYDFPITLSPTTDFTIDTDVALPNAIHYQDSYSYTFTVNGQPAVDCSSLTWSIVDRELAGADKALPPSTLDSPITLNNGTFTWLDVDDPDAIYPVKYAFAVRAVCDGGTIATGVVSLTVDPRNPVVGSVVPVYGYFDVVNDTVTITGLDFYPSTVRFGNEEATNILVSVGNRALTCTPPVIGDIGGQDLPVDVVVYNSDGGVSQSGIKYTYQRKKNPIITDIIPSGGTFRGGTKVAIIGANFEPTSTVIIDGVLQPILSVTPTSIIFVTMPHSVGPADVQVTNSIPPVSTTTYSFAAEPRVSDVQPYNIPADGGIDVYIVGTDFQSGVRVFLDDYEIPADRITVL